MNKTKGILIAVLVTNLMCTFAAGHGAMPLGLLELLTLYSAITFDFGEFAFLSFWTLAVVLMMAGQVLTFIAIRKGGLQDTIRYGRLGNILLALPLFIIFLLLPGQLWAVAVISSTPFLIMEIMFWWSTRGSKTRLLTNGT